jgi:leader peptidase (prepilin peptidase) / N-methyltransferase
VSIDPAAVAIGAVGCGAAGLLVPTLIARIPEPAPDPEHPKSAYAAIAAEPTLRAVAVGTGLVAGGLVGASVGLAWPLLFLLPLVPVGIALAVVDLRTRLLPTAVVWPTFAAVAVLGCVSAGLEHDVDALVRAWLGAAGAFAFFYALWWIHPPGMGFGDVRLSAVLGFALAYLGWPEVLVGGYAAFLAFAVPGLLLAVVRRDRGVLKVAYPFGPFLLAGALAGVVLGEPLWSSLVSG